MAFLPATGFEAGSHEADSARSPALPPSHVAASWDSKWAQKLLKAPFFGFFLNPSATAPSPGPIMGQSVVELAAQDLHHLGPRLGCEAANSQDLRQTPVM